jgi:hypothetical protein
MISVSVCEFHIFTASRTLTVFPILAWLQNNREKLQTGRIRTGAANKRNMKSAKNCRNYEFANKNRAS